MADEVPDFAGEIIGMGAKIKQRLKSLFYREIYEFTEARRMPAGLISSFVEG